MMSDTAKKTRVTFILASILVVACAS
eukprot:COSAG02_NODE_39292_length_419_cov_0.481250_1_plen_25_part_01